MAKALAARNESKPLDNIRHERLAQALAIGHTPIDAYVQVYRKDYSEQENTEWRGSSYALSKSKGGGGQDWRRTGNRTDIKQRVAILLQERAVAIRQLDITETQKGKSEVWFKMEEVYQRAMAAEPVLDKKGDITGIYKADFRSAIKAVELMGLENGMFERTHKHLHGKVNPLEGTRDEIIGRMGALLCEVKSPDLMKMGLQRTDDEGAHFVFIDALSDAELERRGYQRIAVVDVSVQRASDVAELSV